MRHTFPLYQSHIDLAHFYWKQILKEGDTAIDATCGNGHDTFFLASLGVLDRLYSIDLQKKALEKTEERLLALTSDKRSRIELINGSHESFPVSIVPDSVKLIVYNLGFLPGGDKELTTEVESTLKSIEKSLTLLTRGGLLSITCYSGHPEGAQEEKALIDKLSSLHPSAWSYSHTFWKNRNAAPSLILLQKSL